MIQQKKRRFNYLGAAIGAGTVAGAGYGLSKFAPKSGINSLPGLAGLGISTLTAGAVGSKWGVAKHNIKHGYYKQRSEPYTRQRKHSKLRRLGTGLLATAGGAAGAGLGIHYGQRAGLSGAALGGLGGFYLGHQAGKSTGELRPRLGNPLKGTTYLT